MASPERLHADGTTDQPDHLVADYSSQDDTDSDGDSALALSLASSSESLASTIMRHRTENGRSYHAFKEGRYVLPNDETENDRLDLQHMLFTLTFDGKLLNCPVTSPRRVLDAGTGTGVWAIDYAEDHPDSQVVGIDLSPTQPDFVPPNLTFYIDDIEDPWTFSYKFDLIYGRMLTGSVRDWPKFIKQSYDNLESGGWIELADILLQLHSDDDTIPKGCASAKWGDLMLEAAAKFGAPLDSCTRYKQQLADAGFVDIVETIYKWPCCSWPRDPKYKEMGLWNYENLGNGASGLSLALFTRALGWTPEEVEVFLVDVRKDMKNKNIHGWWPIHVVYGRKP
ncbi:S-adenosyl-L-methionine-dependent methyltransferase [Fusarium flagelliforme]|uniref:S-adenosyl-L-methionine-dependent methyltransferase n=1 Tax=Fusarium flagelliforme TaxID=2675880 RepID=UPI001E8DE90D|nr:S-adenosyl-L-methionine-dependent methyltransferase [Fusarium flagelliforme]KAH7185182.1 S-adenosyl-L-methionine-dependent methyltransferase [Fusarium flagelliforme]